MLAGPMDFTPGGFLNRTTDKFENHRFGSAFEGKPAQVLGTRALQLAQFVVYDSPLQVVCDAPDADVNAENAVRTTKTVSKGDVVTIKMAPGGGFAAWFEPMK